MMRSLRVLAVLALATTALAGPAYAAASSPVAITSISSAAGPLAGGERISIHGHGFVGVEHVLFGGAPGRSVHVTSSRTLTVLVPKHKAALLDIRVVTSAGTSPKNKHDRFSYVAAPEVLSVVANGGRITLHGKGFLHVHRVLFGSTAATGVRATSSTSLSVTTPAHAPGTVDVKVVTAFGTSKARTSDRFTFAAPIASIPPASVPTPAPTTSAPPTQPIAPAHPPVAGLVKFPPALVGEPYAAVTLTASAGTPPYRWSEQGLPNGITVSAAGVVSGLSYAVAGTRPVTFTVTDANNLTATVEAPLDLKPEGGQLYSWGEGDQGTLGINFYAKVNDSPVKVAGTTGVVSVAGNQVTGFAVKSDGTVWGWGEDAEGSLGDGKTTPLSLPVQVPGLPPAVAVAVGEDTTYVLLADGAVDAWGDGTYGELGNDGTASTTAAAPIPGLSNIVAIAAYGFTAYAVRSDGALMAWGQNTGLIGDGTTSNVLDAEQIPGLTNVIGVTTGVNVTYALHADGTVSGWGAEDGGALGNGVLSGTATTPVLIPTLTHISQVAVGFGDDYALRSDGTILAWGVNGAGELGVGGTQYVTNPTLVTGITDADAIAETYHASFAVLADGTERAWGSNVDGSVGDGTKTDRATPVAVPGLTKVVGLGLAPAGSTSYALVNPLVSPIHPISTR